MSIQPQVEAAVAPRAPAELVVCAVDFTRQSLTALLAARSLAARWGCPLELVCATDLPAFLNQNENTPLERRELASFRRRVEERMKTFAGGDLPCSVLDGPADEAIVSAARERGAGLVVLGTHGRAGLARLILGSTAEAVIAETQVPVLVVPSRRDAGWPKKILVPMKYSDYSDRALIYAESFAKSLGAALSIVHVVEPGETTDAVAAMRYHVERVLAARAEFAAHTSRYEPAEAILREAEAGGSDLIVMAAHRKPFWRDWTFGMTAQRLLRYSTVPVLTVHGRNP